MIGNSDLERTLSQAVVVVVLVAIPSFVWRDSVKSRKFKAIIQPRFEPGAFQTQVRL